VICDGAICRVKRALVAPFLARRIWNRAPFCVDLVRCEACGFVFYNPRLDEDELRRLYSGYRLEEYQQMRYASEPWYTKKFNADLASTSSYELRRAKLGPILRQYAGAKKSAAFWIMAATAGIWWLAYSMAPKLLCMTFPEYRRGRRNRDKRPCRLQG